MTFALVAKISEWAFIANLGVFAIVQFVLFWHLERAHPDMWRAMGEPSVTYRPRDPEARRVRWNLIFGDGYKALHDARLTALVWAVRAHIVLVFVLWLMIAGFNIAAAHYGRAI